VTRNESDLDRAIRAGISVTALSTGLALGGIFTPVGATLLGVSAIAGLTAATGYCPLYTVLGISTRAVPAED
jgi:hypothetical protein